MNELMPNTYIKTKMKTRIKIEIYVYFVQKQTSRTLLLSGGKTERRLGEKSTKHKHIRNEKYTTNGEKEEEMKERMDRRNRTTTTRRTY